MTNEASGPTTRPARSRWWRIGLAAVTIGGLGLGLAACGHGPGYGGPGHGDWDGRAASHIERKLDLTDVQSAKLAEVRAEMQKMKGEFRAGHQERKEKMARMALAERVPPEDMVAMVKDMESHADKFTPALATKISEFHATLTPEQKQKLAEMIRSKGDGWHRRHHREG